MKSAQLGCGSLGQRTSQGQLIVLPPLTSLRSGLTDGYQPPAVALSHIASRFFRRDLRLQSLLSDLAGRLFAPSEATGYSSKPLHSWTYASTKPPPHLLGGLGGANIRPRAPPMSPPIISPRANHVLRRKPAIPSSYRLSHCPGLAISCRRRRAALVAEVASALTPEGQTRSHTPRRHRRVPTCRTVRIEDHYNGGKFLRKSAKSSLSIPFLSPPPGRAVVGE